MNLFIATHRNKAGYLFQHLSRQCSSNYSHLSTLTQCWRGVWLLVTYLEEVVGRIRFILEGGGKGREGEEFMPHLYAFDNTSGSLFK